MAKFKILLPILAILIVGGIIGALYTQTWNPSWNPFGLSPEQVVKKSLVSTWQSSNYKSEGSITVEIELAGGEADIDKVRYSLVFSGNFDSSNSQKPKKSFDFTFSTEAYLLGASFGEKELLGEVRIIGEDLYLKGEGATDLILPLILGRSLKSSERQQVKEKQWVKINKEDLIELGYILERTEDILKSIEGAPIYEKEGEILKIKTDLGDSEIDGVETYHYLVTLKEKGFKQFILKLLEKIENYSQEEGETPPTFQEKLQGLSKTFSEKWKEFYTNLGEINFEVWIDKTNLYLRRMENKEGIDLSKFTDLGRVKVRSDLNFSNFNQKIEIKAPEQFILCAEFLGGKVKSKFEKDVRIINTILQARVVMTYLYANDGNYDNFSCGHSDLEAICKEVLNNGGRLVIAKDSPVSSQAVCMYSSLPSSNYWYCADNRGVTGHTATDPKNGYCVDYKKAICPPIKE